jgi:hypothetical protein
MIESGEFSPRSKLALNLLGLSPSALNPSDKMYKRNLNAFNHAKWKITDRELNEFVTLLGPSGSRPQSPARTPAPTTNKDEEDIMRVVRREMLRKRVVETYHRKHEVTARRIAKSFENRAQQIHLRREKKAKRFERQCEKLEAQQREADDERSTILESRKTLQEKAEKLHVEQLAEKANVSAKHNHHSVVTYEGFVTDACQKRELLNEFEQRLSKKVETVASRKQEGLNQITAQARRKMEQFHARLLLKLKAEMEMAEVTRAKIEVAAKARERKEMLIVKHREQRLDELATRMSKRNEHIEGAVEIVRTASMERVNTLRSLLEKKESKHRKPKSLPPPCRPNASPSQVKLNKERIAARDEFILTLAIARWKHQHARREARKKFHALDTKQRQDLLINESIERDRLKHLCERLRATGDTDRFNGIVKQLGLSKIVTIN